MPASFEKAYLCEGANQYFKRAITPADVVWTYSGVRPLIDDGSGKPEAATRGYQLELSGAPGEPAFLSVFGGKITTYRHLAEEALDRLKLHLPVLDKADWTGKSPLPGGDFAMGGVEDLAGKLQRHCPFLDPAWADRMARSYGILASSILGDSREMADCGHHFGHGLTERELEYLMAREWAQTAEDVLWRRSKLGLHISPEEVANVAAFMERGVNVPRRLPSPA